MIGRKPYKYQIDLSGKEKQTLRQAKKKGWGSPSFVDSKLTQIHVADDRSAHRLPG